MEKHSERIEAVIQQIYADICGEAEMLDGIRLEGANYRVQKRDGTGVLINRGWVEKFIDDGDPIAKSKIKTALKNLGTR